MDLIQSRKQFRQDITQIFESLRHQRGEAIDVAWDDLIQYYVMGFNGFNPMTTTARLLEVAKHIPYLELPDIHGVHFQFNVLYSDPAYPQESSTRVVVQMVRKVRVVYRMECEAKVPLGHPHIKYNPDFPVPAPEFGEFLDYEIIDES
jgi:hypothetical protein